MEMWSAVGSGVLLVVLWMWESVAPAVAARASWARRKRHLVLGGINACVASGVAFALVLASEQARSEQLGLMRWLGLGSVVKVLLALLLLDLWGYVLHVAAHYVPWLWRVHAVHHNADTLDATVAMRFHTIEVLWTGLATVPFVVILGISVEHVALYQALLLPISLFHHADVLLSARLERVLGRFLVTPGLHRVHHSRWTPETNSNFGAILPVWDWLFGTLRIRRHPACIRVGLDGYAPEEIDSLRGMLRTPFGASVSGYGEATDFDADRVSFGEGRAVRASTDVHVPYTG